MGLDIRTGWFADLSAGRGKQVFVSTFTSAFAKGKYYFEATIVTAGAEKSPCIGIAGPTFQLTPAPVDLDANTDPSTLANSVFASFKGGTLGSPGWGYPTRLPAIGNAAQGDVIGVAVDTATGLVWFRDATSAPSTWHGASGGGTPDPVAEVQGFSFGAAGLSPINGNIFILGGGGYDSGSSPHGASITLNTGATAFTAAAPTGYSAWDNTGATTWNALDKAAEVTLSNGNLTFAMGSAPAGFNQPATFVRSNTNKSQT